MISLDEMLEHIERAAERRMQWRRLAAEVERRKALYDELKLEKERAEAAAQAKARFLANMSHEIRTPMTAILGEAEMLMEIGDLDQAPEDRLEALRAIKRSGSHLLSIIDDILDLSRIEARGMTIETVPVDPVQIVGDAIALCRDRAREKGLFLASRYRGAIPSWIESDPTRLRQILVNLIGNAVKFTETGSVLLEVGMVSPASAQRIRFQVVDTGIGIAAEQRARLFQPFAQGDDSTSREYGGTGLGLAICDRLTQLMGGSLRVESEPRGGSTFTLELPTGSMQGVEMRSAAAAAEAESSAALPSPTQVRDLPRLECRILVAEDSRDNWRVICQLLQRAGAEVEIAENGEVAVARILGALDQGQPFDVVLMDMQMPVMDGYQATRVLRSRGYRGPIIALTAHAMEEDRQRCLDAGCDEYQPKPIQHRELIWAICRCLPSRKPEDVPID